MGDSKLSERVGEQSAIAAVVEEKRALVEAGGCTAPALPLLPAPCTHL